MICGLISEFRSHFQLTDDKTIENILYFHLENCENTILLKKEFEKKENKHVSLKFSKRINPDLADTVEPNTIMIFDDLENRFLNDAKLIEMLHKFASVLCHHKSVFLIFVAQSVSILKKSSKLAPIISNATHFIIMRNIMESKSLSRFLSNLNIKMKLGLSISEIYEKYILPKQFQYILLCVSSRAPKATAYSNILLKSPGNMISYHESDED